MDSKKGKIGSLGIPRDSKAIPNLTYNKRENTRNSPKPLRGPIGIPRDSKKGTVGTLGIPKR